MFFLQGETGHLDYTHLIPLLGVPGAERANLSTSLIENVHVKQVYTEDDIKTTRCLDFAQISVFVSS